MKNGSPPNCPYTTIDYISVATAQNAALGIECPTIRLRGQQLVSVAALVKSLGGGWQVANKDNKEP